MKTYLLMINSTFVFFSTSLAAQTVCNDPLGCQVETPASDVLCWPTFVIERDSTGYPTKCADFPSKDSVACEAHYIGSVQTIKILEDSYKSAVKAYNEVNSKLQSCKKSRGKRC